MDLTIKVDAKENNRFLLAGLIIKILYDFEVITMLPATYLGGMSHGLDFNHNKVIASYFIFLFVSEYTFVKLKERNDINSMLVTALYYLYFLPINSAYYINNTSTLFLILTTIFWIIFVLLMLSEFRFNNKELGKVNYELSKKNDKMLILFCLFISLSCIVYAYKFNGFNVSFNFSELYQIRQEYAGTSSIFESIIFNFGGSLMISITMLYSIMHKKIALTVVSIIAQIATFTIAGEKSQFMIMFVVIVICVISALGLINRINKLMPIGIILLMIMPLIDHYIFKRDIIFYIFIRRLFYIPSWMMAIYYDYFSSHKLLMWTQDVFLVDRLGIGRYDTSVLNIINRTYFHGLMPSPNAGMFAEAYMHWGILGVFLYPIVMAVILNWLFKYVKCYSRELQVFVALDVSLSMISIPVTSGIFCVTYLLFIPFTMILLRLEGTDNNELNVFT